MNNTNTLVAVSAYAGDRHQVEQNMPTYLHHECPVLIMSPEDAPIERMKDATCVVGGLKCWAGQKAIARQIKFLEMLLFFPYEHYLFHDADSICLSPEIPQYCYDEDTVWSNEVLDTNPGLSMLPKIAMQPPYFFSRRALRGMIATKDNLPTSYYGDQKTPEGWPLPIPTDCPDHVMLQLAHGSGFAHKNFFTGASFETASPHGLETMVGLVKDHGRVLVHSIKTKLVLDRLLQEHAVYRRQH